jgi:hypothetical protein
MAIQATGPNVHVTVVATGVPSSCATKQPSGCMLRKRRQSDSTWFHPACRDSFSPSGRSASTMDRISIIVAEYIGFP